VDPAHLTQKSQEACTTRRPRHCAPGTPRRTASTPVYGARPLRRFIAREVETRIGRALLAGDAREGAVIRVGYAGAELTVSYQNPGGGGED
jgi:hypothetical protein